MTDKVITLRFLTPGLDREADVSYTTGNGVSVKSQRIDNNRLVSDKAVFDVVKVYVYPPVDYAEDGHDGGPFEVKVEPTTFTETTWTWNWKAPNGAGNDPRCIFNPTSAEPTAITGTNQAKWFALPNDPFLARASATYNIKCTVSINGVYLDAIPASLTVTLPSTAGTTTPRPLTGFPDYGFDSVSKTWKVIGQGTLARQDPVKVIYFSLNSQFYNKVCQHESKHESDIFNGFDGHQFWTVTEVYPTIQNLTNPTESGLIDVIDNALLEYHRQEVREFNGLGPCFEYRAYQLSDPIAPQYYYQNGGRFSAGGCQ